MVFDSGNSSHLTRNISIHSNLEDQAYHTSFKTTCNQVLSICRKKSPTLNQKEAYDIYYVFGMKCNLKKII